MIVFVGDRPSPSMKPDAIAFQGARCEKRLKEWIKTLVWGNETNLSYVTYNSHTQDALDLIYKLHHIGHPIVALGQNASRRLTAMSIDHYALPHPSGRNRQLNDKYYVVSKLLDCKAYINKIVRMNYKSPSV